MSSRIRKLLDLLTRRDKFYQLAVIVVVVVMAIVEMAGIASIMPFMAVVTRPSVIHDNKWLQLSFDFFGFDNDSSFLIFLGFITLSLIVFSNLMKALNTWLTLKHHNRLNYELARRLLAAYLARPYSFFLNRNSSTLAKNVLAEVNRVVSGIISPATNAVSNGLTALAIMSLLVIVDPATAAGIALVLGGAYAIIYYFVRQRLARIGDIQVETNSGKFIAANEALIGIKDIKVLGREVNFVQRFAQQAHRQAEASVSHGVLSQMPRYGLEIIAFGGILLVVLNLLRADSDASDLIPLMALYAFAGYRLMPAFQQFFQALASLRSSGAALDLLHDDLICKSIHGIHSEQWLANQIVDSPLPFEQQLELRNICYTYPEAKEESLSGLNIVVKANSTIGLVGTTGSGKTTTVDIILGLLTPTSGDILIDGKSLTPDRLANWQANIGYVPQSIYISDASVAQNIAFAIPDSEIDMDAVIAAARIAKLHDFVMSELAEQYDTRIGDRGIRLSGGQRQRIGIARAMYRDPSILLLDEATSALDGITEHAVMEAVRDLSRRKTVILIAHRLTTVKDCDAIFLLNNGVVEASGKYDELIAKSTWFKSAAGH